MQVFTRLVRLGSGSAYVNLIKHQALLYYFNSTNSRTRLGLGVFTLRDGESSMPALHEYMSTLEPNTLSIPAGGEVRPGVVFLDCHFLEHFWRRGSPPFVMKKIESSKVLIWSYVCFVVFVYFDNEDTVASQYKFSVKCSVYGTR